MEEVIALLATITACLSGLMLVRALTIRLQGKPKPDERLIEEVEDLRERVASLQGQVDEVMERQDFSERLLTQARERGLLGNGQGS